MQREHNFAASLAFSHAQEDAPWWEDVYRQAFPDVVSIVSTRQDGWAQRGGIDRIITRACGKVHYVDEKVRSRDTNDILLEYWSDATRKKPGWIAKNLACDFIAYAFRPTRRCFLLPFETLRRAWRLNCDEWQGYGVLQMDGFRDVVAHNRDRATGRTWRTESTAVPLPALSAAMQDAMLVRWH